MGMEACVLAIGGFGDDVKDILDYPADWYDDVKPGVVVTRTFFNCNTAEQSRELASALGTDADDFNTHHIADLGQVSLTDLVNLSEHCAEWGDADVEEFVAMFMTGRFFFLFMPNA